MIDLAVFVSIISTATKTNSKRRPKMKVLVLGDSITKGIVYDDIKGKYVFSDNSFVNLLKSDNIEIENASLMGSTVTKGMKMLERLGDEVSKYDYTAIEFGGNDCNYTWSEVSASPDSAHFCLTPPEKFRSVYKELVNKIRSLGSKPVIVSLPPIDSSKFYKWIIRGLNEANIFSFLGDKERLGRWQQFYNLTVSQIARSMGVPFIDITSPFFQGSDFKDLFCTDGIHPNESGHRLIYNHLKSTVIPQIA